jgi:hypothetical protein
MEIPHPTTHVLMTGPYSVQCYGSGSVGKFFGPSGSRYVIICTVPDLDLDPDPFLTPIFFGGLQRAGHSFASVAHFAFLRDSDLNPEIRQCSSRYGEEGEFWPEACIPCTVPVSYGFTNYYIYDDGLGLV